MINKPAELHQKDRPQRLRSLRVAKLIQAPRHYEHLGALVEESELFSQ